MEPSATLWLSPKKPGLVLTWFMQFISPAGDVQILGPQSNMDILEVSSTYVVLSWDLPTPLDKEPLTYFIEKVIWLDS